MALAGWIFMAIWIGMLVMFTWLFVRDGGFHQFDPLMETGIMLAFWVFGSGGASYMFGMPLVTLAVQGDDFVLTERWLRRRRISRFAIDAASRPSIVKTRDSEGDDIHILQVTAPGGRKVTVGQHPDIEGARSLLARMDQAIGSR